MDTVKVCSIRGNCSVQVNGVNYELTKDGLEVPKKIAMALIGTMGNAVSFVQEVEDGAFVSPFTETEWDKINELKKGIGVKEFFRGISFEKDLEDKTVSITQNGTSLVLPSEGKIGLSSVTTDVNVSGGGSSEEGHHILYGWYVPGESVPHIYTFSLPKESEFDKEFVVLVPTSEGLTKSTGIAVNGWTLTYDSKTYSNSYSFNIKEEPDPQPIGPSPNPQPSI